MAEWANLTYALTKAEWERLMEGRTRNLTDSLPSVRTPHAPSQQGRAAANSKRKK